MHLTEPLIRDFSSRMHQFKQVEANALVIARGLNRKRRGDVKLYISLAVGSEKIFGHLRGR